MPELVMYIAMAVLFITCTWCVIRSKSSNIVMIMMFTMMIGPIFFYFYPDYGRKGFIYSIVELVAVFGILITYFITGRNPSLTWKLVFTYIALIVCHCSMTLSAIFDNRDYWTWLYYEYINAVLQFLQVYVLLSGVSSDRKRYTDYSQYNYNVTGGSVLCSKHKETVS